jgi:NADPH-dependent 2,4-dienoyl-CoA reductase/sulfur reductase-like enzyme
MTRQAEVLVVGAGPAGIAAALRAHEAGSRVVIVDDNPAPGGQIWRGAAGDTHSDRWFQSLLASGIPSITNATVIAADAEAGILVVETLDGPTEIRFQRLVIATGSREVFLPFPGWTLPGVTGVGGLQALVKSGLPIAGKRVVIAGSGPLLLATAAYLRKHDADVSVIAEQAGRGAVSNFVLRLGLQPPKLLQAARLRVALAGIPYRTGCWVEVAEGNGEVERVRLRSETRSWMEPCDYAAVSYGLYPNTEVAALLGCAVGTYGIAVDEFQQSTVKEIFCVGECTGIGGVDLSLVEGEIAGYAAAGALDRARALFPARERHRRFANLLNSTFQLRPEVKNLAQPDTIFCRCEDVRMAEMGRFSSMRAAKLHTRCGMGPCQGRICGTAASVLFGWTGTSIRPPVFPASVAALAFGGTRPDKEDA